MASEESSGKDTAERGPDGGGSGEREVKRARSAKELLLEVIPRRAEGAGEKLRIHLTGKTAVILSESKETYVVDWSGAKLSVAHGAVQGCECSITIPDRDLLRIHNGELNPQVAMLSHRLLVQGRAEHAIYLFNLVAPHQH